MKIDALPPDGQLDLSLQPAWQHLVDEWRDSLAQSLHKPSRRRIHTLRSLTLRLRVALEYWPREKPPNPAAADALKRWKKEGKKLRRALQPVRDADVYLSRLDRLRKGSLKDHPKLTPRCLRQIDKLESLLKQQRQRGVDRLMASIQRREKRLNRLSREMEATLAPQMRTEIGSTTPAALRIFTDLANEFPVLDSTNLHTYRKRLKTALCLTEISAANDPMAGPLSATFRMIQRAAGEWHDWQTLTLKANRILHGHTKQNGLAPVLESLAERALQKALGLCERSTAQLLQSIHEQDHMQASLALRRKWHPVHGE